MNSLHVWRIENRTAVLIGEIASAPIQFRYSTDYLLKPNARAISLSLPLRAEPYDEAALSGIAPQAKYTELTPTTASAITRLLRTRSSNPVGDLGEFVKISLFNYLIGNCDNHLKNLSLLYSESWGSFRLAPAYLACREPVRGNASTLAHSRRGSSGMGGAVRREAGLRRRRRPGALRPAHAS